MNRRSFFQKGLVAAAGLFGMAQLSGCAAGNFGLVRSVAQWNDRFSIFPRILIYIALVIIPVYELSMLFDLVINNTIEFWTGQAVVHASNRDFEKDGARVNVAHFSDKLRKTVITVFNKDGSVKTLVTLQEGADGKLEVLRDAGHVASLSMIGEGRAQVAAYKSGKLAGTFVVHEGVVDRVAIQGQFKDLVNLV